MRLSKLMITLTVLASTASWAGTLTVGSNIELLAYNGQKVSSNTAINLDNGTHQVAVSVSDIINGSYFSIEPMILTFNSSNENIKISTPKLTSGLAVDKFRKALDFQIETDSGNKISYKKDFLKGEGFVPNAQVEDNLARYNRRQSPASVPAFANAPLEAKGQILVETNNVKEEQLQLLFKKADKITQKRFVEWAKKQL